MILEALNYAATWSLTSAEHRKAVLHSVNLWSRGRRCAGAWREHEENSKAAMLAAARSLGQRRTAVVLGSGLLRDVPIVELSRLFDTVVLVDLVHVASVRAWLVLKGLRNVRLVERDLSGLEALLTGGAPRPLDFLRGVPYLDLVVSANLISQIGMAAKRRLEREGRNTADALPRLVRAHFDGLEALPCRALVVTDVCYDLIDRDGRHREHFDLLHGVPTPVAQREWLWPVAPLGEESPDYRIVHRVVSHQMR